MSVTKSGCDEVTTDSTVASLWRRLARRYARDSYPELHTSRASSSHPRHGCAMMLPSVARHVSVPDWGAAAFALCLAACSSQRSAAAVTDSKKAQGTQQSVAAPGASFRASLTADPSLAGTDTLLTAPFQREARGAQSPGAVRSGATMLEYPKVGDVVLVDVSSYDDAQKLIERVNIFGILESRAGDAWHVRDRHSRQLVAIRLSLSAWSRAPKGVYHLRTTGEVVGQPAYAVRIERYASLPASGRIIEYRLPR